MKTALAGLVLAGVVSAQIQVPGDYATIQLAIDNASPGDVIVIAHGDYGPIVIDKPLTLVGNPHPHLYNQTDEAAAPMVAQAPVTLAGPGNGAVVLCDLEIGGGINGLLFSSSQAGITGGGFDELYVVHCTVDGPRWQNPTGVAAGVPAIDVDVASVLVSDSALRASPSDADDCYGTGPDGPTALRAPGATVQVLDSTVTGGGSMLICDYAGCPTMGGEGGTGVEAATLWEAASTIVGGTGAPYWDSSGVPSVLCGQAPDGAAYSVGTLNALPDDFRATSEPELGSTWSLTWNKGTALFAAFTERNLNPFQHSVGAIFIDLVGSRQIAAYPAGAQTHSIPIPALSSLIGLRLTAQVWEFGGVVSRPVTDVIRP